MPSPYAHLIAAIAISTRFITSKERASRHKEDIATLIAFSFLADLDVIPGILFGNIAAYHNHFTHSIAFGFVFCLLYSLVRVLLPGNRSFGRSFVLSATAYGLHLVMDYFTFGRGLMLFWPLTEQRFSPPFLLFYGLRRSYGFFTWHHLITFLTESFKMLPVLGIALYLSRKHAKNRGGDPPPVCGD